MTSSSKIVITGGAGLVGQNLVAQLKSKGFKTLVVLDKHKVNLDILKKMHPDIMAVYADLAEEGPWEKYFEGADSVVMLQAQIGGLDKGSFMRNNIKATHLIIKAMRQHAVPYLVHVSSSVVESVAEDIYTHTKIEQEQLVLASGIPSIILRPTLMFGWFDRKHLGWLSRFMRKVPIFPIPGKGDFIRQPLYAGDFCQIIMSCLRSRQAGKIFNISGLEKIKYIEMIRQMRTAVKAKCIFVHIPYGLFYLLLKLWAVFDRNPPFTADQLKALVAGDLFEKIDWPKIFKVNATPFDKAVEETFNHPTYSNIFLDF